MMKRLLTVAFLYVSVFLSAQDTIPLEIKKVKDIYGSVTYNSLGTSHWRLILNDKEDVASGITFYNTAETKFIDIVFAEPLKISILPPRDSDLKKETSIYNKNVKACRIILRRLAP